MFPQPPRPPPPSSRARRQPPIQQRRPGPDQGSPQPTSGCRGGGHRRPPPAAAAVAAARTGHRQPGVGPCSSAAPEGASGARREAGQGESSLVSVGCVRAWADAPAGRVRASVGGWGRARSRGRHAATRARTATHSPASVPHPAAAARRVWSPTHGRGGRRRRRRRWARRRRRTRRTAGWRHTAAAGTSGSGTGAAARGCPDAPSPPARMVRGGAETSRGPF